MLYAECFLRSNHRQHHLEILQGFHRVRLIGRHDDHFTRVEMKWLTRDGDLCLTVEGLLAAQLETVAGALAPEVSRS